MDTVRLHLGLTPILHSQALLPNGYIMSEVPYSDNEYFDEEDSGEEDSDEEDSVARSSRMPEHTTPNSLPDTTMSREADTDSNHKEIARLWYALLSSSTYRNP